VIHSSFSVFTLIKTQHHGPLIAQKLYFEPAGKGSLQGIAKQLIIRVARMKIIKF